MASLMAGNSSRSGHSSSLLVVDSGSNWWLPGQFRVCVVASSGGG